MHFGFHFIFICRWVLLTFNDIIIESMPMLQAPARRDNVVGSHAIHTRLQEQRIRDSVCQLCALPIASLLSLSLPLDGLLSVGRRCQHALRYRGCCGANSTELPDRWK